VTRPIDPVERASMADGQDAAMLAVKVLNARAADPAASISCVER